MTALNGKELHNPRPDCERSPRRAKSVRASSPITDDEETLKLTCRRDLKRWPGFSNRKNFVGPVRSPFTERGQPVR